MTLERAEGSPMQPFLQGCNAGWICDFPVRDAIGHVEGVDRRAFLGTDTRESDGHPLLPKSSEQFVEQPEPIRRLNLNERVGGMRFVFDGHPSRKIHLAAAGSLGELPSRSIKKWCEIEVLIGNRAAKDLFYVGVVALVGHRAKFRVADPKNVQDDAIAAGVNIRAQDVDWNDRERARDLGEKLLAIPSTERSNTVALLRERLPGDRRSQGWFIAPIQIFQKAPEESQVRNESINLKRPKIIVRHEFEVRVHFLRVISAELFRDLFLQELPLDFRLLVECFLVGKILRSRVIELPDEGLLPVRPRVRARALPVGQGEQH